MSRLAEIKEWRNNKLTCLNDVAAAYMDELLDMLNRKCVWKRHKLGTDWDEYDSWGTSCGEDYAIVEEWDDTPPPFCGHCGGKAIIGE